MTPLHFYQVAEATPAAIDAMLPALLGKAYASSQPMLVLAPTAERAQRLEEGLWGGLGALGPESFLPHGKAGGAQDTTQPILIGNLEEHEDATPLLVAEKGTRAPIVLAGAEAALPALLGQNTSRVFYVFSTAAHDTTRARALYKEHKAQGRALKYYAQENGRWVEKG